MSFNMAFDGPECPHFGAYQKRTLGDSLCMSKEKATRMGSNEEDETPHLRREQASHRLENNDNGRSCVLRSSPYLARLQVLLRR